VRPDSVNGWVYRFAIPAGSATASLASRSAVPAEVRASARDLRRLGVPVERLVLYDTDLRIEAGDAMPSWPRASTRTKPATAGSMGWHSCPRTGCAPFPANSSPKFI
jgi:hypothetical protein